MSYKHSIYILLSTYILLSLPPLPLLTLLLFYTFNPVLLSMYAQSLLQRLQLMRGWKAFEADNSNTEGLMLVRNSCFFFSIFFFFIFLFFIFFFFIFSFFIFSFFIFSFFIFSFFIYIFYLYFLFLFLIFYDVFLKLFLLVFKCFQGLEEVLGAEPDSIDTDNMILELDVFKDRLHEIFKDLADELCTPFILSSDFAGTCIHIHLTVLLSYCLTLFLYFSISLLLYYSIIVFLY
jgi:hypothetical protein